MKKVATILPRPNAMLAFKADVVLSLLLICRHHAPRVALALVAGLVALVLSAPSVGGSPEVSRRVVILAAGLVASVAASRPLARGGPLLSLLRAASAPSLSVGGRLLGTLLFAWVPAALVAILVLGRPGQGEAVVTTLAIIPYACAVIAGVFALTPLLGASGAATTGVLAALIGSNTPSQVAAVLSQWPAARGAMVFLWNSLPLSWRVQHWLSAGGLVDAGPLVAWIAIGFAGAVQASNSLRTGPSSPR